MWRESGYTRTQGKATMMRDDAHGSTRVLFLRAREGHGREVHFLLLLFFFGGEEGGGGRGVRPSAESG